MNDDEEKIVEEANKLNVPAIREQYYTGYYEEEEKYLLGPDRYTIIGSWEEQRENWIKNENDIFTWAAWIGIYIDVNVLVPLVVHLTQTPQSSQSLQGEPILGTDWDTLEQKRSSVAFPRFGTSNEMTTSTSEG